MGHTRNLTLGMVLLVLAGAGMGGCASNDSSKYEWSAQKSWRAIESNRSFGTLMDVGGAVGTGHQTSMADANAHRWDDADRAIKSDPPTEAVEEMIDDLAQELATDLPNLPEIAKSQYQVVLAIGSVESAVQSPLLENILDGIETRLRANEAINNAFLIVTTEQEDAEKVIGAVSGNTADFEDPAQRGEGAGFKRYDPRYVYQLKGRLTRLEDRANFRNTFNLFLTFDHLLDKRRIKTYEFKRVYYWQPYAKQWISEEDELARRRSEDSKD